jgi:hypothetical protein
MLFLDYQYSNHAYLERSLEPSLLGPNYNDFTICGQELGCEEDHDHIMMLNYQPTFHIPNITLLKPHRKTQPQDHLSFQASHPTHTMVKLILQRKTLISTFSTLFMKMFYIMRSLMKVLMILLIHVMSPLLKILIRIIKILHCFILSQIHCVNSKRLRNLIMTYISLLHA